MIFLLISGFPDSILPFRGALIEELQAKGQTVHIAAPDLAPLSPLRLALEARGIVVHEIPLHRARTSPLGDARLLLRLVWLMLKIRPQRVLSYTVKPVVYGTLAAWIARVPDRYSLVTGLGYAFQGEGERKLLRSIVRLLYALAMRSSRMVFFQNPDDTILFRQMGILPPGKHSCVVNGSGVDLAAYAVTPLPAGHRFLLIARLLGDKGVREYAEAARRIHMEHPSAVFALVGWIDENPDSIRQRELDSWIAEGSVKYLGRLSDVRQAIADCNVYVLPSYREGTPRTVLEAMSMGRAIITTDAPGCRETVVDGVNGLLVPVKSAQALEHAMMQFIENPMLALQMGQRSRDLAEGKYDVHRVNAQMLSEMGI